MSLSKGFRLKNAPEPLDFRRAQAGLLMRNIDGTPRGGVLYTPNANGAVAARSSSRLRLTILDQVVLALVRTALDGSDIVTNVGAVDLDFTAPTANSQYVTVWARQNDTTLNDQDDVATISVTVGAAQASPAIPAAPTGATKIGHLLIPAGATTLQSTGVVWTETIPFTTLAGGTLPYRNVAERDADKSVPDGTMATIMGGELYYRRSGTWKDVTDDTGWIVPTAPAGFTFNDFAYRRKAGVVYLRGNIKMNSGAFPNGYTSIMGLGAAFAPRSYLRAAIAMYNGYSALAIIGTDGFLQIGASGDRTADTVYLGAVSYTTD